MKTLFYNLRQTEKIDMKQQQPPASLERGTNDIQVPDCRRFPRFLYGEQIDALTTIYRSVGMNETQARRAALADLQADFGHVALAA